MIVETRGLVVNFRRGMFRRPFAALAGLDLEVHEGDFFALLGQNGAGKTTAMHCLVGVLRPSAGTVRVLGSYPEPGAEVFKQIAYLPEEPRYPEYLTVSEAVTYYAALSGVAAPAGPVADVLDRLGLGEYQKLHIRRCSKGMKQKVGIAQCLVHRPRLLFLDEPMRGLDPMAVHLFREILLELNRGGATIVMNSHILAEVEMVANRVAIIDRGRLVVQDEVANLVRVEQPDYVIEVEGDGEPPPQILEATRVDGRIRGSVPAAALYDVMDGLRARSFRVVSCGLRQARLEERFMALLGQGHPHA
jgi:ABC-2 type transport system ATP-binding protein